MSRPRRSGRYGLPGAEFVLSFSLIMIGLLIVVAGGYLSFRIAAKPALNAVTEAWHGFIRDRFGQEQVLTFNHVLGGVMLLLGAGLVTLGAKSILRRLVTTLNPALTGSMAQAYVRRQQLARGYRIVAIGGGTGLSTLLRGLKRHSSNITAIVTVTDDGGSSGRLSEEMGIIPPGDIRNCLVALADAERQLTDIFQYRFKAKSGSLSGHSLGNLLIAGLIDLNDGDFERALAMASEVLAIRGQVIPSTLERVRLRAHLDDGRELMGETTIVHTEGKIRRIFLDPEHPHAYPDAIQRILEADLIVMGPGSVYTSVIPNLLVPGIAKALLEANVPKVYVCNVMTQPGESDEFTAAEHVMAIEANVENRLFTHVLVNTQMPSSQSREKYRQEGQIPVVPDADRIRATGLRVVEGDFVSDSDFVRHDPMKLAEVVLSVLKR